MVFRLALVSALISQSKGPFARLTACVGILRELGGGGKEHRRAHWPWQSGTLAGSCISAFLLVPQPGAAKSEGGDWFEDEVDRGTFPTVIFHNDLFRKKIGR